jgi:multicomponent Na+:H+ antiporter subunit F
VIPPGDGGGPFATALGLALGLMGVALLVALARLVRGPSLPDRVVALELAATLTVGIIAVYDVATEQPVLLDVAAVLALLGFLGSVAFARYVEQGAPQAPPALAPGEDEDGDDWSGRPAGGHPAASPGPQG